MEDKTANAYLSQQQRNLDNERVQMTTTNTANTVTLNKPEEPKEPKTPKSTLVMLALGFLCLAFILASVSAILVLPLLATFAILDGLAAVTFAVLSLRETA